MIILDDGKANESVTWKYNFISFVLICDIFNSFNFYRNLTANYRATKLVGMAFRSRNKMKKSPSYVHVHHETLNLIVSHRFAEDGKETDVPKFETLVQSDCFCSLNLFAALSLPSQSSLLTLGLQVGEKRHGHCREIAFMERWPLVEDRVYV